MLGKGSVAASSHSEIALKREVKSGEGSTRIGGGFDFEGTSIKADAGSTTVTMGKHRGRTFEHVWMNEKGYVQFVLGQEEPFGQMKDMKEYFTQQR
eukprot:1109357-Amphidinium_carterae.1